MKFKALGIIFLFVVFAAVVSGVYYWQTTHNMPPNWDPVIHKSENANWNVYADKADMVQVKYPKEDLLNTDVNKGWTQNYFAKNGEFLATITIPNTVFPKTNFGESYVTISQNSKTNASDCKKYSNGASQLKKLNNSQKINDRNFDSTEFSGAAAGNLYETRLYRIFHGGVCYEVSLTLHTSNIGNYPKGTVSEVNHDLAWNSLIQILNTFKLKEIAPVEEFTGPGALVGHVDIGPNCPVEQMNNPCQPTQEEYDTVQIIVYSADKSQTVAKATLDASGNYSFNLPIGTYYVTYDRAGQLFQSPMDKIIIKGGQTVTQDFSIDTGLR